MSRWRVGLLIGCTLGCSPATLVPVEENNDTGVVCMARPGERACGLQLNTNNAVDILFVIDNSASMGAKQAALAKGVGALVEALENPSTPADYRIAFTTTDNGNPLCEGTTPEHGDLVFRSCLDRLEEFELTQGDTTIADYACANQCEHTSAQLGIDGESDPWLVGGIDSVLPPGVSTEQALACLAPQGVRGCGFGSPLEAAYQALEKLRAAPSGTGFLREQAVLTIIFVTDKADCSFNPKWTTIFEADGDKPSWWDPATDQAGPEICWRAGVVCTPDGTGYTCLPQDFDAFGEPLDFDDPELANLAVLHPLGRYIDQLQEIENTKKEINPGQELIVTRIAGLAADGVPVYADTQDQDYMAQFGIGPGCEQLVPGPSPCASASDCVGIGSESCNTSVGRCERIERAMPPVRLHVLGENFTAGTSAAHSICEADLRPALRDFGEEIVDQLRPACYTECVADDDPSTPNILDPDCDLEIWGTGADAKLRECLRGEDGAYVIDPATGDFAMPSQEIDLCFAYLADPDGSTTPDPNDTMHSDCVDDGYNLQFRFVRRPGSAPLGGPISGSCQLSELPQLDCPDLG